MTKLSLWRFALTVMMALMTVLAIVAVPALAEESAPAVVAAAPAAAAPAVVPAVTTEPEIFSGPWWGQIELWQLVFAIVVFLWGILKAKNAAALAKWDKIVSYVEIGVQRTYDEFVRQAKLTAPNGKLTAAQVKEARDKAWVFAKDYAKTQGMDLAKEVAVEYIPVLISQVVEWLKGGDSVAGEKKPG